MEENRKIVVAMDQSRKSGKFIMLNQAVRKNEITMPTANIAEAENHRHHNRTM